jgi:hypothetical protein
MYQMGVERQGMENIQHLFWVVPLLPSRKPKGPQPSPHPGQSSALHAHSSKEAKEEELQTEHFQDPTSKRINNTIRDKYELL